MGQIFTYKCIKCGNEIELNEGNGMRWHSFDKSIFYPQEDKFKFNIYDEFNESAMKDIHKFIDESEDVFISDVYYQPYVCNKCGKMESKIYFKMYGLKTNKTYRLMYICDCGGRYRKLTNKDKKHLCCNKCKSEMLEVQEKHLFWD